MKISIQEVKEALKDPKFKASLPAELQEDIKKYESNPSCPCNFSIYRNILKKAAKELMAYYPEQEIVDPDVDLPALRDNNFTVINCHVDHLERKLKELGPGSKQIAVARYDNQVTVIVNELDAVTF